MMADSRCEPRLVVVQLVAARILARAAMDLLKEAMMLSDGRLPSFRALGRAHDAAMEAYAELERELGALTGYNQRVLRLLEEVVAADAKA